MKLKSILSLSADSATRRNNEVLSLMQAEVDQLDRGFPSKNDIVSYSPAALMMAGNILNLQAALLQAARYWTELRVDHTNPERMERYILALRRCDRLKRQLGR